MNLAELYAAANQRNALARRREPLDAPFDPLHQIPAGMPAPLRTGDVASMALQNAPGVGDVASLIDAYRAWQMGDKLQGGLSAVAALPFVGAIKAYHGSPHKFDAFDMSKIGTGEGAQVYGHGLYFAESPNVARDYAERLSSHKNASLKGAGETTEIPQWLANQIDREGIDGAIMDWSSRVNEERAKLKTSPQPWLVEGNVARLQSTLDAMQRMKAAGDIKTELPQNLYETSLEWPDPAREASDPLGPQHFLDWDRPINEQSPAVSAILEKAGINHMSSAQAGPMARGQERYLAQHGIPGIRYLDAGSRGAGEGSSNYVVFDDQIPKITARNGQPLQRPDLTRQGIGAGPLRMATDDELRASLEAVHGRNAAKGLDSDIATGAIRDEIARRNAVNMLGLPESNTAADRARAMGFDTPAYHGTTENVAGFDPEKVKARFGYSFGHHTTTRPAEANYYAHNSLDINRNPYPTGGNVMPLNVRNGRTLEYASDQPFKSASMVADLDRGRIIDDLVQAKRAGEPVDIVKTSRNFGDEFDGSNLVAMRPELLRSRFAAFDPARRDSGNLLAQILGGVGLAHLYAAMSGQQERP